ncbi:DUF4917 family protein [Pedobacter sp. BMA]|uniref:DUF4917 family protein n=1 Tax=Pedobacter sp. BMA TaxID=1663685 RepID=UPI0006498B0A|nr:DUF4917 family protein [Pedobacter sp. BMA]KLT64742.1 hypothetical protein AB669_13435 [Pedobacter sp. BMA]
MLSQNELSDVGIFDWQTMKDSFEVSDILIGNGFSINLWPSLRYDSLCELFCSQSVAEIVDLFKNFNTTNFEVVLSGLNNAEIVNSVLGSVNSDIPKIKQRVKDGLIHTIQTTHPEAKDIRDVMLRSLAKELEPFSDVYTTNYDVYLYKIILANNTLVDLGLENFSQFGDGFYTELSKGKLSFDDFDYKPRNLIYLHGSLFMFNPSGSTYKIRKIDGNLEYIKLIKIELDNNNFPVYVAEGTAEEKYISINENYYLRSALNKLKSRKGNLVTFGFSFGKSDRHIVEAINSSKTDTIVASVWPNRSMKDLQRETSRVNNLFPNKSVQFFDSRTLFSFDTPKFFY